MESMTDLWELIAPYLFAIIAGRGGVLKALRDLERGGGVALNIFYKFWEITKKDRYAILGDFGIYGILK